MEVTLLGSFSDESIAHKASAICVGQIDNPKQSNLQHALKSNHLSVVEHLPLTFLIEGVTRDMTHQLVRHRIASYSQLSERYTKFEIPELENMDMNSYKTMEDILNLIPILQKYFVIPPEVLEDKSIAIIYISSMLTDIGTYQIMLAKGFKSEVARGKLPSCRKTSIIMSTNLRAFIEQSQLRTCLRAQSEINELFHKMVDCIKEVYPSGYALCAPACVTDKCKEAKPCGQRYERK